jgi:copper transport protein
LPGRSIACAVLAAFVLLGAAFPSSAPAHARLLRTTPAQGAALTRAPAQAELEFDEPVRSTGPATLSGRPVQPRRERGGRVLVAPLPAGLRRGTYRLRWAVVSDDGHREAGTLTFGIGERPAGVVGSAGEHTQSDVPLTLGRWLFVLGVLAAAGLAAVRLVLRPVPPAGSALMLALTLVAVGAAVELAAVPASLDTRFGAVTAVAGALAFVAAAIPRLRAGVALVLIGAPALSGHALSPGRPRAAVLPIELIHTAAAAAWLGAVLWLAQLAAPSRRLTAVAVAAVGAVGATGIARAALELQSWSQLGSTGYGRFLLLKTAVLLAVIALGAWNRTRRDGRALAGEAVLLAAIAGVVAGLGSTTPPRSLAAAPQATIVLGRQVGGLAVGIAATRTGDALAVEATVLGPDGDPAGGRHVVIAGTVAQPCGSGRYCARVRSAPRLAVRIDRSSTVAVALPADPQPARAAALIAAGERALRSLHSLAIDERLTSDPAHTLRTTWHVVAPDRLSYTTSGGGDAIVVGARRWDRARAGGRWELSEQEPRLRLPALDWDRAVDPSLLGTRTIAGRAAWVVSFRDPTVPAWFEVALDRRTRRPLVVRMIAAGHFMVRRYRAFDAPLRVRAPF